MESGLCRVGTSKWFNKSLYHGHIHVETAAIVIFSPLDSVDGSTHRVVFSFALPRLQHL